MDTTRSSLLIRIRNRKDTRAWSEFHDIYSPLLYRYARARGLNHEDAEDVRAKCYEAITRQIQSFDYEKQKGGFKAWLRTIADRRVVDHFRKRREANLDTQELAETPDDQESIDELWQKQWRQQHLRFCIEQARQVVSAQNFEAFRLLMDDDCSPAEVSQRMNITTNQVYKAKSRVLAEVRSIMQTMFPEDFEK